MCSPARKRRMTQGERKMSIRRLSILGVDIMVWILFLLLLVMLIIGISSAFREPVEAVPVEPVKPETPVVVEPVVHEEPELPIVFLDCEVVYLEPVVLYDVPLEEDLQKFIIEQAESKGIDPAVIFGMARKESTYDPAAIGDNGNAFGLLQIWPKWNMERMVRLDCLDLLDPYQNVTVAIDLMSELLEKHNGDVAVALTVYNNGHYPGYVTDYAKMVLQNAAELTVVTQE